MQLQVGARLGSLEQLLDQVDSSARAIPLVLDQPVGRTDGGAITALHAGMQDGFGFAPQSGLPEVFGQHDLHF